MPKSFGKGFIMEYLQSIILGAFQGATEFLPISSSGHLSLLQNLMGINGEGSLMLTVFLHFGTLVAVIAVYYKTLWSLILELGRLLKDLFTGKIGKEKPTEERHMLYMMILSCVPLLFLFLPVGGGNNLMDVVERLAEDDDLFVEATCFLITGLLLFFSTRLYARRTEIKPLVNTKEAWWVGVAQVFAAAFPGISRSGSTISTGMLLGVNKDYMVEYSFVLGTPAVLAATLVELKGALEGEAAAVSVGPLIVGIIVAAAVGVLAIKLLRWMVNKDKFRIFSYYCFAISLFTYGVAIYQTVNA